jgi:hypothetical protein
MNSDSIVRRNDTNSLHLASKKRLLTVADRELENIPFAALPVRRAETDECA